MAFPRVPKDWTASISEEHGVPSRETRREIARLLKAAVREPPAKQRATWAKAAKLLPKELREIIGKSSPQRELERILPDVPMVSLNGMVDGERYIDAVAAIERSSSEDRDELLSYLSAS